MGMPFQSGAVRAAAVLLALACSGCDLPKDPDGTTARVQGHVLRAGVSENPPWVRFDGDQVEGVEADIVRGVAGQMHAQVQWVRGGEGPLFKQLKQNQLDIVAAGLSDASPWSKELGVTKPYAKAAGEKHMLVTAAGENRWLLTLDRYLQAHKDEIDRQVAQETAR